MASIEKVQRKDGIHYKITVSCGYDITGKKLREKTTFKPDPKLTPKQQEKALRDFVYEFEHKVLNGQLLQGEKITFYEFVQKWVTEYAKAALEPSTLQSYANYLDKQIIPYFGHYKLSEIRPLHLLEFYNYLQEDGVRTDGKTGGYSAGTIKKYHAILSTLFSSACKWEMIETNPCDKVSPPKQSDTQKLKYFTLEQVNCFLQALDLEYKYSYKEHMRTLPNGRQITIKGYCETRRLPLQFKVFFYMALFSGSRREELIALTWDKIDFEEGTITIDCATGYANQRMYQKDTKNKGSNRLVALPESVMQLIAVYKEEWEKTKTKLGDKWVGSDHVFIQWNGKQMHLTTPTKVFKDVIDRYNEVVKPEEPLPNISLHGLRHTHATLLISANTDIKTVSSRLGHANTSTTLNIYAHSLRKADKNAANAFDDIINKK